MEKRLQDLEDDYKRREQVATADSFVQDESFTQDKVWMEEGEVANLASSKKRQVSEKYRLNNYYNTPRSAM